MATIAGIINSCAQQDGNFTTARFGFIQAIYFDSSNSQLLISDSKNNRVKALNINCMNLSKQIFIEANKT